MQPAARLTDMHACPMVTPGIPPVPHVGGPILPACAPTVLTGALPQARISDMALCVGPPDVIAQGAMTVLVAGLPAARIGDMCVHGGAIVVGLPTVLIGGPTFSARPVTQLPGGNLGYGSSIEIAPDADPQFQSQALASLIRLDTTPNGRAMFDAIERSTNKVTIVMYVPPPGWGPYNAYTQAAGSGSTDPWAGSNSTVGWSPYVMGFGPPGTTPNSSQPGADIILGHEMIHATHNALGTAGPGVLDANNVDPVEERNTVGLPATTFNDPSGTGGPPANGTALPDTTGLPYTENGLRSDYRNAGIPSPVTGQPPVTRPSYYPPTATDGPGAPF